MQNVLENAQPLKIQG